MTFRFWGVLIALVGASTTGMAQTAWANSEAPHQGHRVAATWLRKPEPEDLLAVWPSAAMAKGITGKAVIECTVNRLGALTDCRLISESPAGMGFGAAALAMTPQFLMKPATVDGTPVDGEIVRIPLNFATPPRGMVPVERGTKAISIRIWTSAPSVSQVVAVYPAPARKADVTGRVTIACTIGDAGRLKSCDEVTSNPRNVGLFAAANSLSKYFVAPTEIEGGSTKGLLTQVSFVFDPAMLNTVDPLVGKPDWIATPTLAQIQSVLPKDTHGAVTVRTRLQCLVIPGGLLEGCKILSEDPPGLGLGAAFLSLASNFKVSVWSQDGLPTVGGQITIPFRYDITNAKPTAAPGSPAKP